MTGTFHCRPLGHDDIPLIQTIGRATYEPYYAPIWYPGGVDWYMERCFGTDFLQTELANPQVEYLIPRNESGEIIGLVKLLLQQPTPEGSIDNALYLEKIYLMPGFFGQGAGRRLIEYVFEKAARLGREAVWLMVLKNGPVHAYERAGFRIVGEVSWEYELLREEERGGWVMIKMLSANRSGG